MRETTHDKKTSFWSSMHMHFVMIFSSFTRANSFEAIHIAQKLSSLLLKILMSKSRSDLSSNNLRFLT